ncbi:hypothetical protein D1007_36140 [Hordeum vulgare]|nr:hypothetical protein D1007_36140 [Hordeum vulgare]
MPSKKYVAPRLATDPQPKPRKPRAPMPRPPGLTNAQWKADVGRRAAVTNDRRNRLNMKKTRNVMAEQDELSRAAMANEGQILPPQQIGQYRACGS